MKRELWQLVDRVADLLGADGMRQGRTMLGIEAPEASWRLVGPREGALYTTRAMRRVSPDPIPDRVQARILDVAIRAPSGGNSQNWRFMLVDDPAVKSRLGPLYRECIAELWDAAYADRLARARATPDDPASKSLLKVQASAQHLADQFEGVPLFMFAFSRNDTSGSIFPAVWSAQLATRLRRSAAR